MTDRDELRKAEQEATRLVLAGRWVWENLFPLVLPVTLVGCAFVLVGLFVPPVLIIGGFGVAGAFFILLATIAMVMVVNHRLADTDRRRGIRWNGTSYDDISDKEQP